MTPEEKAKELQSKFNFALKNEIKHNAARNFASYNCALIAVHEILKVVNIWSALNMKKSSQVIYWEEVKQEIENL